jgi:hypothetical protein
MGLASSSWPSGPDQIAGRETGGSPGTICTSGIPESESLDRRAQGHVHFGGAGLGIARGDISGVGGVGGVGVFLNHNIQKSLQ